MGDDHPVSWCQDLDGGRVLLHRPSATTRRASRTRNVRRHLEGAIKWAAGLSDPIYSDCGATVLANYKQVKISAPPNLNEPIGFDQLPDGRVIQTARAGTGPPARPDGRHHHGAVDLATPRFPKGRTPTARTASTARPWTTTSRQNKWVYLYYSPPTVTNVRSPTARSRRRSRQPLTNAPTTAASLSAWDPYVGYFQLSRFKFVEAAPGKPAHLDLASEQEIMRVPVNRGACCHVARRHRLRPGTATCGSSRATTRRPAAATRAASSRSTT